MADVAETGSAPTNITLSNTTVSEGQRTGSVVGTLNAAPYVFTWNTTQVPNGVHRLSARAVDAAACAGRAALSLRLAIRACSRCRLFVVGRERCAIGLLLPPAHGQVLSPYSSETQYDTATP